MIIISACLCGVNCKYDGNNNLNEDILKIFKEGNAQLVCPEQLGGQSTPRIAHEIINGDGADVLNGNAEVVSKNGERATRAFLKGAYETFKIAKAIGANVAILKARSPSCGAGLIYDGSFSSNKIVGNGVTAELLLQNGIKVYNEENYKEIL